MDEKSVKRFIVISCTIVVLLAVMYELKYFTYFLNLKKKHFLLIGILSSPENFQQRLSIRETWLQLLSDISASVYFIVGDKICEVPPNDRADPYSCVDRPIVLPENATELTEFSTMEIQKVNHHKLKIFIGFSFYIRRSIIVTKLGILKELLIFTKKEIQVKLISAFTNKVLASVTFNSESQTETNSTVITKAIRPMRLHENFEGILKLDIKDNIFFPQCNFFLWKNEPYVINYIQLWQEGSFIPQPFDEKSCTFIVMTYTVKDAENINLYANNRTLRLKEWKEYSKKLAYNLKKEHEKYNDIFLADVIDVYRNISVKLLYFYKRIRSMEYFDYILKADDDSFIDVLRVYEHLKQIKKEINSEITQALGDTIIKPTKYWWWSYFKEFWKVERSGKWRENQYQSVSYPTFPCGGGYVVNKMIVDYIAENKNLHHFQGEDVSLGIWLSALPVTRYKTPRVITNNELQKKIIKKFKGVQYWEYFKTNYTIASNLCEWTCDNKKYINIPLCNKVQLGVPNMYAVWKDYIEKGFL